MFIVQHDANYTEFDCAYDIIGSDQERELVLQQATALSLAAIGQNIISRTEARSILDTLATPANPATIYTPSGGAFLKLLTQSSELRKIRQDQLITAGMDGKLGAVAISEEFSLLDDYRGGPFHPDIVTYVTTNGIGLYPDFHSSQLEVDITEIEDNSDSVLNEGELALAKQIGATHSAYQYEIPPSLSGVVPSHREHISLGITDVSGSYKPMVTVLNDSHPARITN